MDVPAGENLAICACMHESLFMDLSVWVGQDCIFISMVLAKECIFYNRKLCF